MCQTRNPGVATCAVFVLAAACLVPFFGAASEQSRTPSFVSSPRRLLTAPELTDAPDDWIERSLQWVDYILRSAFGFYSAAAPLLCALRDIPGELNC